MGYVNLITMHMMHDHATSFLVNVNKHTILKNCLLLLNDTFFTNKFRQSKYYLKKKCHFTSPLCWFQTSLPLAALPLLRMIIACCFRVTALCSNAALVLSLSSISPELNRIQVSVVCRCGQSDGIIDLLASTAVNAMMSVRHK